MPALVYRLPSLRWLKEGLSLFFTLGELYFKDIAL